MSIDVERPSHGYRAVHVVAFVEGKPIEIQVRTPLQHLWAELSEKLSDLVDPAIKYGGGEDPVRLSLAKTSDTIANEEKLELDVAATETLLLELRQKAMQMREQAKSTLSRIKNASLTNDQLTAKERLEESEKNTAALEAQIATHREAVRVQREAVRRLIEETGTMLREIITSLPERKGETRVVLD